MRHIELFREAWAMTPAQRVAMYVRECRQWPRFCYGCAEAIWRAMDDEERKFAIEALRRFDRQALARMK